MIPVVTHGSLLISEPLSVGGFFERTVVLMCEHNDKGSFGLVVNKPSPHQLADVVEEIEMGSIPVFLGGPVEQNTLHFIHRIPNVIPGGIELSDGIYWGGNFEEIIAKINMGMISDEHIRFFAGYSGWSAGQLNMELEQSAWITREADVDLIFDIPEDKTWRQSLLQMGGQYKVLANYPIDPQLN